MPPGTGDIALTLSQLLPLTGAVVVCTPQDVALLDAVKAIAMFRKVNIPMLGMVENMSYFICPDCGKRYDIFGSGGAKRRAAELDVPFLGEVPINIGIRERGDAGETSGNFSDEATADFFQRYLLRAGAADQHVHKAEPPLPTSERAVEASRISEAISAPSSDAAMLRPGFRRWRSTPIQDGSVVDPRKKLEPPG